jgi:tetratricopeptide (TPR) repeat protein
MTMNSKWFALLSLALSFCFLSSKALGHNPTASELLQKGIYLQETVGDLDGAIKIYRQVAHMAEESRANAAQAEYRLAVCLQKKGQQNQALETLRKLIREYPDQTTIVTEARGFLHKPADVKDNPCQSLEDELQGDSANSMLHKTLLDCYMKVEHSSSISQGRRNELQNIRVEHLLWFIQRAPEDDYSYVGAWVFAYDVENYVRVKHEWTRQVKAHPSNVNVLINAARVIRESDQDEALELALKAHTIDPQSMPAIQYLADLYEDKMWQEMRHDKPELKAQWAHQALQLRQQQWDVVAEKKTDLCLLRKLATDGFEAGDDILAQKYADELLRQGQQHDNSCRALHHGNLMLGRIALKKGNLEEAKVRLVEAGKISTSPFSPNMMLAKELLEKGQREIVLQYLDECANFWKNDHGQLDQWRAVIRGGGIPNFRNLD